MDVWSHVSLIPANEIMLKLCSDSFISQNRKVRLKITNQKRTAFYLIEASGDASLDITTNANAVLDFMPKIPQNVIMRNKSDD